MRNSNINNNITRIITVDDENSTINSLSSNSTVVDLFPGLPRRLSNTSTTDNTITLEDMRQIRLRVLSQDNNIDLPINLNQAVVQYDGPSINSIQIPEGSNALRELARNTIESLTIPNIATPNIARFTDNVNTNNNIIEISHEFANAHYTGIRSMLERVNNEILNRSIEIVNLMNENFAILQNQNNLNSVEIHTRVFDNSTIILTNLYYSFAPEITQQLIVLMNRNPAIMAQIIYLTIFGLLHLLTGGSYLRVVNPNTINNYLITIRDRLNNILQRVLNTNRGNQNIGIMRTIINNGLDQLSQATNAIFQNIDNFANQRILIPTEQARNRLTRFFDRTQLSTFNRLFSLFSRNWFQYLLVVGTGIGTITGVTIAYYRYPSFRNFFPLSSERQLTTERTTSENTNSSELRESLEEVTKSTRKLITTILKILLQKFEK